MYEVTIWQKNNLCKCESIFQTPSRNCALSCAQTLLDNAGITSHVWDGVRLYAGFFTEDYFDEEEL